MKLTHVVLCLATLCPIGVGHAVAQGAVAPGPTLTCDVQPSFNGRIARTVGTMTWGTVAMLEDSLKKKEDATVGTFFDAMSDELLSKAKARCADGKAPLQWVRASVVGSDFKSNSELFWGEYDVRNGKWRQRHFNVDGNYRVEQGRLNELSDPVALADLAKSRAGEVVDPWVLFQNPFVYKGKVVVLRTQFGRMLDQDHAAFELNHEIHVEGVPSTKFRTNGEKAMVAIRVTGSEKVNGPFGMEFAVPTGVYVDGLNCDDLRCGL